MDKLVVMLTSTLLALLLATPSTTTIQVSKDPLCHRSTRYGFCNDGFLPGDDPSGVQFNLLMDFSGMIDYHDGNSYCYPVQVTKPEVVGYGYFSCRKGVKMGDCHKCYITLGNRLIFECTGRAGGIFSSGDCCLRYELYDICGSGH